MTESQYLVVSFDSVKNEYIRDLKVYQSPTSNDALLSYGEGRLIFIEFKNGNMHTNKQHDVRKKIFDSLLIFTDIAKVGISYTRSHMDYILVYNENKYSDSEMDENSTVGDSKSRDQIGKRLMALGNDTYIKFGLEMFKNYCFKDVYTYTECEFEKNFVAKYATN